MMNFKIFIIIMVIIGLNGCGSSSTKKEAIIDATPTDIPKMDEGLKIIKIPIIPTENLNE